MSDRKCSKCGKTKPYNLKYFNKDKSQSSGMTYWCKDCTRKASKKYDARPEVKATKRAQKIKRMYGVTVEWYDDTLEEQNGVCATCKQPQINNKRFCIDHDHETGKIRGLLCDPCNMAIGLLKDDPERISAMLHYLLKHKS